MFLLPKSSTPKSSRYQIQIKGVEDNTLIIDDHKYRAILEVSTMNFELKSEEEQDGIINNYQSFLNALPCSIQILFRVREMDLDKYLDSFREKLTIDLSQSKQDQVGNYSRFVKHLVSDNKILSRSFYLVLPFNTLTKVDQNLVNQQLKLLEDIVSKGLGKIGIRTRRLTGLEILDLFYSFYNPEQSKTQSITNQTLELINRAYL